MYYRRYFSGTVLSNTEYRVIKNIGTGRNINNYYNQTNVLQSAIKQTLEDVGIQCEYDTSDGVLVIDGVKIQIVAYNSNPHIAFIVNGKELTFINGSSYTFSAKNYRFYITLKGDIDGILQIFIGLYNTPQAEIYGLSIGKGTDLKDGTEVRVVLSGTIVSENQFYVLKNNNIIDGIDTTVEFGQKISNIAAVNNNGTEVTLVDCVASPGRFKLNNCFFGNLCLPANVFYNIGGDIYYQIGSTILIKCTSNYTL